MAVGESAGEARERIAETRGSELSPTALDAVFRAVIEQIPDGVLLIDPATKRILKSNAAIQRILGYTSEELSRLTLYEVVIRDPAALDAMVTRLLQTGEPFFGERQYRHKDSRLVDVEVTGQRFMIGPRTALCAIVRDISERKRMSAQLVETKAELQALVSAYPDVYFRLAPDGTFLEGHASRPEELYRPLAELVGLRVQDAFPAPVGVMLFESVQRVLASGRPASLELSLPFAHGEQFFESRLVPLPEGQVFAVLRNISERRRKDTELRYSQRNYELLVHSIDGIVWVADARTGKFQFVSKQAERILGYPLQRWLKEPTFWVDHVHADDRAEAVEGGRVAIAERRDHRRVYRMLAADGRTVWLDDVVSVEAENGEVVKLTGVMVDVTERKRAEEELRRVERHLHAVVDHAPVILFALDGEARVTLAEGKGLETVGLEARDLIGRSIREIYRGEPAVLAKLARTFAGEALHETIGVKSGPGAGMTFEVRTVPVTGADGLVAHVFGVATDVSERRQAEEDLRRMEERLSTVVNYAPVVLFAIDRDGIITLSEGKALEGFGLKPGELVGRSVFEVYRDDAEALANVRRALAGESFCVQVDIQGGPGMGRSYETYFAPVRGADGSVTSTIGVSTDLTERRQLENTVKHISYHDALTDLPNWELFQDRLAQAVSRAQRTGEVLAVLLLDVDRFKLINDTLGHAVGERVLQEVARRLKTCIGTADTVARMGGDEYVILQMGTAHAGDAARMAQRVHEVLKPPLALDGHNLHVTMSVGISLFPYDGEDPQTLLKNADAAMYHAKETGRSSYHFYSPAMNAKAFEKLALENSLRRALEHSEFVLYYQPQVDIKSGKMIGMEALARWRHPDLGLVSPLKFIPLAEDTGVIVPLGEWILREAARQNKAWQDAGLPPVRVAVNLSARQFQQPDLVDMVVRTLRETRLEPCWLEFEITESIAMKDPVFTTRVLRDFKRIGVQIAIDDFGIGYSSLSSLKTFPLDSLKIDRSFIQDLNTDPIDAAIATALIALGHRLNMRVVAEGVETEDQLRTLLALECDTMQGYLFCRPVPPEELQLLLAKGTRLYGGK